MDRKEQLRQQMLVKVATFAVGDTIRFYVPHRDDFDIELIGKILSINGCFAEVEHEYGVARAWLWISDKVNENKGDKNASQ